MNKALINLIIFFYCSLILVECTRPSECELSFDSGSCRGMFPAFYFNSSSKQCEDFIYGGCGGNENRFETKEECLKTCAGNNV